MTLSSFSLEELHKWKDSITAHPYRSYLYSYPHKTAYRDLQPPMPLETLWRDEPAESFFLYMHIPFCGARCGFCNLFTLPDKRANVHATYVDALERQAKQWAEFTRHKPYARFAIGGGTPTLLAADQLRRLFHIAVDTMGLDTNTASISVETSPETITEEKLNILKEYTVDRVSMGIQSFVAAESAAIYRPQNPDEVYRALELLGKYDFPILNLDLIYGLPGQTVDSWLYSLNQAISFEPEEIFIYPLYTREHTIVKPGDIQRQDDIRLDCYKAAGQLLRARGYRQYSMRRFAKEDAGTAKPILDYSCQEEGMVGLGCGARSYTRHVHYASRYGVSRKATESIISDYVATDRYDTADYGIVLSLEEQKRRFILKAILHSEGLKLEDYSQRFGQSLWSDYPELSNLLHSGLGQEEDGILRLTTEGMGYSDSIGDWFISGEIREQMERFVLP
ncbi:MULTISPECIES: STM4012 family radical SAM protein [unclassified Paenibacillus]|uniref:STM4012 family radical SAM protein n=1 Tax=unclassified Paenibacillus TaxID=185978 RepID=UPI002473A5FE|nr:MULTISPECIES: STM4012 family radical SAM protein [unclassified Paenibacillus]MDH6425498.1 oxygen-independent coproporphyrinogen-3 oxidase [Paenibacillus sp. PastH-4]MDH6441518.1 oxygen-independent coproporphyrinogen-3 oxidase [Paenibacillus sp. PastF-4]MDH6529971.1 oxygen-independent coproporphyrinogen-3 oxidase [Paenibacillus sp. PastH-3]